MKRRLTLRVESLDNRIMPSVASGIGGEAAPLALLSQTSAGRAGEFAHESPSGSKPSGAGDGIQARWSKPGGTGEGIQVSGGKEVAQAGTSATGGVELFGTGYKPGTTGGHGAAGGVELFGGSQVSTASGDN